MSAVMIGHHCKKTRYKVDDCKLFTRKLEMEKTGKSYDGRKKRCSYHNRSDHSNEERYR